MQSKSLSQEKWKSTWRRQICVENQRPSKRRRRPCMEMGSPVLEAVRGWVEQGEYLNMGVSYCRVSKPKQGKGSMFIKQLPGVCVRVWICWERYIGWGQSRILWYQIQNYAGRIFTQRHAHTHVHFPDSVQWEELRNNEYIQVSYIGF